MDKHVLKFTLVLMLLMAVKTTQAQYCSSAATDLVDEYLTNVTFAGINNNSGSTGYSDFTAITGTANPGVTYPFSSTIFINGTFTEYVNVYIDWNNDQVFSQSERYDIGSCNSNGCTIAGSIAVPISVTAGPKRMRVFVRFNTFQADPCEATFLYGEVEDYTLNVLPLAGRDAGITSWLSPVNLSLGVNAVSARVTNLAADPINSVDMSYQLGSNAAVSQAVTFSTPLAPGASSDVVFTTPINIATPGSYNLKIWLANANGLGADNNTSNDTLTRDICTGLTGALTIGASGTYPTITAAIADLVNCGISAPVTFLIQPGTYYGSYTLNNILGAASPNSISFTSSTSNAADVILIHDTAAAATNKSIFTIVNTPNVSFSSLTFQRTQQPTSGIFHMVRYNNESNFGGVISCVLQDLTPIASISSSSYGIYADNSDNLNFSGNIINGFYYSIYLTGPTANSSYENFNQLIGNTISNYRYAIYGVNQASINLVGNTISTAATTFGYGTYLSRAIGATVNGNIVSGTIASGGMYFFNMNDSLGLENLIVNNVVSGNVLTTGYGIYMAGSFEAGATVENPLDRGIFYHNSVNVSYGGTSGTNTAAMFFTGGSDATPAWSGLTLTNNMTVVRARAGGGMPAGVRGVYISHDSLRSVTASNYNNIYLYAEDGSLVSNAPVRVNITDYLTLADWTLAFGQDANSISTNPNFVSQLQPIPSSAAANNLGTSLPSVSTDILGNPRNATSPDMGAYEFSPPANDAGLMFARGTQAGCADDSTTVTIKIANYGTSPITSVTVGYFATSGANASVTLSSLNLLTGDTLLYTFAQRALLSIGMNTITAHVTLAGDLQLANDSAAFTVNKFPLISTFPYFENWENGAGGWASGGNNGSWAHGTPTAATINTAFSGSNVWATNLSGQYNNNEQSYIQSPCFDLTGLVQPYLEFKLWWITETNWDGLNVQYSLDGGSSWQVLGTVGSGILNWYTRASVNSSNGNPVWAGSGVDASAGYVTVRHGLNFPANSTAIFRLHFSTDGSGVFDGIAVDDFVIGFPPPADMSVIAVTSPTTSCNGQVSDTVRIRMVNAGTVAQSNFPVSYRVNNLAPVTETYVPNINPGDTVTYTFTTRIAGGLPVGTQTITAYPSLTGDIVFNNDTVRRTVTVVPSVSTFPYVEGFENGNGGWTTGGANSSWAWGMPNDVTNTPGLVGAYNGARAWATNLTGSYNNSEASWVMSPCFDLSSMPNVRIRFGVWYSSEASWDGGNLQYSIDGGNTWTVAGSLGSAINWYNTASVSSSLGQPVWAGNGGGWLPAEITMPQLANQANVRLRFNFYSDGSLNGYSGVAIDSFILDLPTDPVISSVTIATDSCINATRAITANIVQFRQLTSVNLHYNITGTQTYTALPMTRVGTTSNWTATIPVSAPVIRNRYFVSVVDSIGLTDTSAIYSYKDNYLVLNVSNDTTIVLGDSATLRSGSGFSGNRSLAAMTAGANGSQGVTFNLTALQDIMLDSIATYFYGTIGAQANAFIWYTTSAINGSPNIVAPAWTLIQPGYALTIANSTTTPGVASSVPLPGGVMIPAGSTYGFYIGLLTGGNTIYTTYTTGGVSTFTDGYATIENGTNVGYGGGVPVPVNHPRQFIGSAIYRSVGNVSWRTLAGTLVGQGDTIRVGPTVTTTYVATIADALCSKTDTVTVFVGNALPDIGVSMITVPAAGSVITNTNPINVTARIKNYGGVPASGFDVEYRVNGGASIITNSITQTIAPGDSMMHTFTLAWTPPATGGNFTICANTTGMPNEVNRANDTSCVTLTSTVSVENLQTSNRLIGNVYPNPAESFVNFEFNEFQGKGTLEIHDKLGRVVATVAIDRENGNVQTVRTESWAAGMYSYRFIANDQVQHGNLIIKN